MSVTVCPVLGLLLKAVDHGDDPWRWRWLLTDEATGATLADHTVAIDPASPDAEAFTDLYRYVRWNAEPGRRAESEAAMVERVGAWAGANVLGAAVCEAIARAAPVTVRVQAPDHVLTAPLELAHIHGTPLARRADVTLAFDVGDAPVKPAQRHDHLRMVAVFSLPTETTALALRRERYELTRLVRRLAARAQRAVQLEVLQYGVTRELLRERMTASGGPDILHLSGHGTTGQVLLETADGRRDPVSTNELLDLLRPAKRRLRLAVLSACQSAAAATAETLRWLQLDEAAEQAQAIADAETAPARPGIAREVAQQLGCAVVAMRYPVLDEFAIALAASLYEGMFVLDLPVDEALRHAVRAAAEGVNHATSIATPTLLGVSAIGMSFTPPKGPLVLDPAEQRMAWFPDEPVRFVGRAGAMVRASRALAPGSGQSGVLFHGMAGAGKTSCALELAYRHRERFTQLVWWQAPLRQEEWPTALTGLAIACEGQLPGFAMVDKIGTLEALGRFLPRLRTLLRDNGLLLVLDNLESLLTPTGQWHDPRWAQLIDTLTNHGGESRVVLTSRVKPAGLPPAIQVEPVHALSRDESVLLARELPHLRELLREDSGPTRQNAGRATVRRVLHVVQGHPKLLELADAAAADPGALAARLDAAEGAASGHPLAEFFARGESGLDDTGFVHTLAAWTHSTVDTLPAAPQLLLRMLAGIEDDDRRSGVVEANWASLCFRVGADPSEPSDALSPLIAAALVDPSDTGETDVRFLLHPGIAETVRATTPAPIRAAIDTQLDAFWTALALENVQRSEGEHTGRVVYASLAAIPYLLRQHHWDVAAILVNQALSRDATIAVAQIAVAHLSRIAEAAGTSDNLVSLGKATARIDPAEGERMLRIALDQATNAGNHRLASLIAGDLVTLLAFSGRLSEALALADHQAELTRLAGLGTWTQIANDAQRLQILYRMGRVQLVLTQVHQHIAHMARLPDPLDDDDLVTAWNVRESLLNLGAQAATTLERWQEALDLNAEIIASKRARGAGEHAIAIDSFNDGGPLLQLGRLDQAERLLLSCQRVCETHDDLPGLARVFDARAQLAAKRGHHGQAIDLAHTALRLAYTLPDPAVVSDAHHNLATHLSDANGDPLGQLAHRLASATIRCLTGHAASLDMIMQGLAQELSEPPRLTPPGTIAELAEIVQRVEGVRFTELVNRLGDAQEALTAVLGDLRSVEPTSGLSS